MKHFLSLQGRGVSDTSGMTVGSPSISLSFTCHCPSIPATRTRPERDHTATILNITVAFTCAQAPFPVNNLV